MIPVVIDDIRKIGWRWCTTDQLISPTPAYLLSVMLTSSGGGAAHVTIRNGHNASAEPVLKISALANYTSPVSPVYPIYLDKGLYVDLGNNVEGVLVIYYQEDSKQ